MTEPFTLAEINDLRVRQLSGENISRDVLARVIQTLREDRKAAKPQQKGKLKPVTGKSLFDLEIGGE